jgi:hypothetical protein
MRYYILYPGNTEADTVNSVNQLKFKFRIKMPKIRRDRWDNDQPIKEKRPRRKAERWEEFTRDSSKRNKRNKKRSDKPS